MYNSSGRSVQFGAVRVFNSRGQCVQFDAAYAPSRPSVMASSIRVNNRLLILLQRPDCPVQHCVSMFFASLKSPLLQNKFPRCETRFFRATGSQYREPLARGDQSQRRGAESHRSKHKYKEPPELRRRRLFVFNCFL